LSTPAVTVIVISWNGGAVLRDCLVSLRAQTTACRVIVVDNGSTDGSQAVVAGEFPEMRLIENGRNLGFGEGNNVGMRAAMAEGARYVALLNQDARADAHWVEALLAAAESDPAIGAVGSRMLLESHPGLLNSTGVLLNLSGCAWDRGFARADGAAWRQPVEILAASGGAMLLRTDALRRTGLFDADYFAYFEDVDLGVRLWEDGYRVVYAPDAEVTHHFSLTLGDESFGKILLIQSNRWRFIAKNFPIGRFARVRSLFATDLHFASRLRMGRRNIKLWLKVYARALAMLPGAMAYRLTSRVSRERRQRWWRFVEPQVGYPQVQMPSIDYTVSEDPANAWTDRLIMGVNDRTLGRGWYPLVRPMATTFASAEGPALRAFGLAATCVLRVATPGRHVIQVHVAQPEDARAANELTVTCNGVAAGRAAVTASGRWQTLHFPVTLAADTALIELRVRDTGHGDSAARLDYGLQVNEISVLRDDSPLLRPVTVAAA
jgi:GT2 family glycosyltransferase